MGKRTAWWAAGVVFAAVGLAWGQAARGGASAAGEGAADLRINQIQVIGTHNSYHAGFAPGEAALMQQRDRKAFESLDYGHRPLTQQLDSGVRQIELDVYRDTKGGRFAHPAITEWVAEAHLPPDPPLDPGHKLDGPGLKTLHVPGVDQRSTCLLFTDCLKQVRAWSAAHPGHLPIFVLVETKYDKPHDPPRSWATGTEPWTTEALDELDGEIRSVFAAREIISPDEVRGSHKTLPEAIVHGGWPTLQQARGKVLFLMDQSSMTPVYTAGSHAALKGRVLFTHSTPGAPDAAFIEQNEGTPEAIDALVRQGYLVRTRTDEPTAQARANDTRRRDAVLGSGAQMLSTDYPASEPARWAGHYSVGLPGRGTARCNPVNAPAGCGAGWVAETK